MVGGGNWEVDSKRDLAVWDKGGGRNLGGIGVECWECCGVRCWTEGLLF